MRTIRAIFSHNLHQVIKSFNIKINKINEKIHNKIIYIIYHFLTPLLILLIIQINTF